MRADRDRITPIVEEPSASRPFSEALGSGDTHDRARAMRDLEKLADLLDNRFVLPGTNIRFGLDGLIGLIPGIGDTATALISAFLILRFHQLGVSRAALARMVINVGIDALVGSIPVVGDVFDVGFKANRRNMMLARRSLEKRYGPLP